MAAPPGAGNEVALLRSMMQSLTKQVVALGSQQAALARTVEGVAAQVRRGAERRRVPPRRAARVGWRLARRRSAQAPPKRVPEAP